jgi:hypothetical protein
MFSPRDITILSKPKERKQEPNNELGTPVSQKGKPPNLKQGDKNFLRELSFDVAPGDAAIPLEEESLRSFDINSAAS